MGFNLRQRMENMSELDWTLFLYLQDNEEFFKKIGFQFLHLVLPEK